MKSKTILLFLEWITEVSKIAIQNCNVETAQKVGLLCLDLQEALKQDVLNNEKIH